MVAKKEKPDLELLEVLLNGPKVERDFADISLENYRTHYICGEIDEIVAQDACEFLMKSYKLNPKESVELIVNSPGGSCTEGFAIIDTIAFLQAMGVPVRTVALGQVCSMGFMIFVAGTKGERVIAPNCTLMMHQFYADSVGKMHELEAAYKEFKNLDERIVHHLVRHVGLTAVKARKTFLPSHDVFMTADEALKLGIGDKLLEN